MQEESSTKGERDRRLQEPHCVSPAPAAVSQAHVWRRMRLVAACAGAAATLILAALVIISVYDYWPRASLRSQHARVPALAPDSMPDERTAVKAAARGGYDTRREVVARTPFFANILQEDPFRRKAASFANPSIPRPFFYRPSRPTVGPFRLQTPHSPLPRAWIDRYRSAQRLKNLEHVVQYLQRNAKAQVAELAPAASDRLAFTATWYNRQHDNDRLSEPSAFESSGGGDDPLRGYRPHHPGDVNLLAEEPLRFSLQPAATMTAASFRRLRFPPRRICYDSRCPTCNSPGDHFHTLFPPETEEADRKHPSLFMDVTPEERASSVSKRNRPSFLLKPRFRPKGTFNSNGLMLRPIVKPLDLVLPNRDFKSRFHSAGVTTSTIMSPIIIPRIKQFHYGASAPNNNIDWLSRHEVSVTSPSLNFSPSSFMQSNYEYTVPKTTPPSKPFIYMLNPATNANDIGDSRFVAPTRIPNEPEIIKFKIEDAKVHKSNSKISAPQLIENGQDNRDESVTTARNESNDAGRRVLGDVLRNGKGSTTTHAPSTPTTTTTMTTTMTTTTNHTPTMATERGALTPQINGHYRSLHVHSPPPPTTPPTQHTSTIESYSASDNIFSVTVSPMKTARYGDGGVEVTLRPKYIAIDRDTRHRRTSTVIPHRESDKEP